MTDLLHHSPRLLNFFSLPNKHKHKKHTTDTMGRKTKTLAEQLAELDNPAPRGTAKKTFRPKLFLGTNNQPLQTLIQKRNKHKTTATTRKPRTMTTKKQPENTTLMSARASCASVM
jgi:hypothetical protein